ncbi:alpha/beta fold hydrolase [Crossiella cryophila]|uniref:Pimeloyl-ACP methyl ester carboxylesterase n=1 Tax=Crossiella cryophila TaxID=43355 RepID=A0A7W7CF56_9PSEU|nr:alpha/beta hydrolase [Crossiella cryophila]MBB4678706.1 pimeloyl-ACP methyl ester carboxylesterase [Crossiella cryophila]
MRRVPIGELISVAGHNFHVRQDGDPTARPLVLLHGFRGSMHWFDRLTPLLATDFRVIRVDLPGHGCTGGSTDLDALSQGRAVAALVKELDLSDAAVAGHSYGADVTLALAAQSDRVSAVVVIAQGPDYTYASTPRGSAFLVSLFSVIARTIAYWPVTHWISRFLPGKNFDNPIQAVLDQAATAPRLTRMIFVDRGPILAQHPLDAQLRDLGLPSLVILGEQDPYYDCAKTTARYTAAGVQVKVIPGAPHSPFLAQPSAVAGLLWEFLRR